MSEIMVTETVLVSLVNKIAGSEVSFNIPYKGFKIAICLSNGMTDKRNDIRLIDVNQVDVTNECFSEQENWLVEATATNLIKAFNYIDSQITEIFKYQSS